MTETQNDIDPIETQEWLEALASVVEQEGPERARFIIETLLENAKQSGVDLGETTTLNTAYVNTIPVVQQPAYPGDLELEQRIDAINRWNAIAMVIKAKKDVGGVGGHLSSYASIA